MDYLAGNPATAAMTAVQQQRYLVVPFAASEAGVRSVEAAASLAEQWRALETR
jgi:iron complex transport system substrate-binding protein